MSHSVHHILGSNLAYEEKVTALMGLVREEPHLLGFYLPNTATKAALHGVLGTLQLPRVAAVCRQESMAITEAARLLCADRAGLITYLREQLSTTMDDAATFLLDPRNRCVIDLPEKYAVGVDELPRYCQCHSVEWVDSELAFGSTTPLAWDQLVRQATQMAIVSQNDVGISLVGVNELSLDELETLRLKLCESVSRAVMRSVKSEATKVVVDKTPTGVEYTHVAISGIPLGMYLEPRTLQLEIGCVLKKHQLVAVRIADVLRPANQWHNDKGARYMSVMVQVENTFTHESYHQGETIVRRMVSTEYHSGVAPANNQSDRTTTSYRLQFLTRGEASCWGQEHVGYVIRHLGTESGVIREQLKFIKKKWGSLLPRMVLIPFVVRMFDVGRGTMDMDQISVNFPRSAFPLPSQRQFQHFGPFGMEVLRSVKDAGEKNLGVITATRLWMESPQHIIHLSNMAPNSRMVEILEAITECTHMNAVYGMRIETDVYILLEGLRSTGVALSSLPYATQERFSMKRDGVSSMIRIAYRTMWPGIYPCPNLRHINKAVNIRLLSKSDIDPFNPKAEYMRMSTDGDNGVSALMNDREETHYLYGPAPVSISNPFSSLDDDTSVTGSAGPQMYSEAVLGTGRGNLRGLSMMSGSSSASTHVQDTTSVVVSPLSVVNGIGTAARASSSLASGGSTSLSNVR